MYGQLSTADGWMKTWGEQAGKDAAQLKATYPAVHGITKSHAMAQQTMHAAIDSLHSLGGRAAWLKEIALFLGARKN